MISLPTIQRIDNSFVNYLQHADAFAIGIVNLESNARYVKATPGFDFQHIAALEMLSRTLPDNHGINAAMCNRESDGHFNRDNFRMEYRSLRRGRFLVMVLWHGQSPDMSKNAMRICKKVAKRNDDIEKRLRGDGVWAERLHRGFSPPDGVVAEPDPRGTHSS